MDEPDALAAILGDTPSPAQLAAQGATIVEIAQQLGMSQVDVARVIGPITPAQLDRLEHVQVARGVGTAELAPHVQAAQMLLNAYRPETYGRQAQAGTGTLRVVIDGDWRIRDSRARTIEGELVPAIASQDNDPPA